MKKVSLVFLLVALSTVIAVGSAFAAGVIGTPHDVAAAAPGYGTCSVCHIPHKSAGNRLWASAMGSGLGGTIDATKGIVSSLCSFCHIVDGGAGLSNAGGAELTVYAYEAHDMGINEFVSPNVYGAAIVYTELQASDLPYTGDSGTGTKPFDIANPNSIQCTSCHNVHDNAQNRPFLRINIRDLCVQCHADRWYTGGSWAYGKNTVVGDWPSNLQALGNPGTHPIGTNLTGDTYKRRGVPDTPIGAWAGDVWDGLLDAGGNPMPLMQLFDDLNGTVDVTTSTGGLWNLGLHTANADASLPGTGQNGGVVCVSCHAIHGVQDDTSASTVQVVPNANLLARAQSKARTAHGSNMGGLAQCANGDGSLNNDLCEMCHWNINSNYEDNSGNNLFDPSITGTGPNPGATSWTHPMNDVPVINSAGILIPSNWPRSSWGTADDLDISTNLVICESCHVPHPYRNGTTRKARPDVNAGAAAFILRDLQSKTCAQCHAGNLKTNHHPVGNYSAVPGASTMGVGIGAGGNDIGDGDSSLECDDCHNNPGAHNWMGPNDVGLDPDWIPTDNARGVGDTVGGTAAGMSTMCEGCHYQLASPAGSGSGSIDSPTVVGYEGITVQGDVNPDYDSSGTGTHYLGAVNTTDPDIAIRGWTSGVVYNIFTFTVDTGFDPRSNLWPNGNNSGGWSRWGTGTGAAGTELVCESCHELEPDKNAPGSKLLLYFFADGTDGSGVSGNTNADTSYFCEGCHGENGPSNTHALTGDTVSRTNAILSTSVTGSFLSPDAPTATPAHPTNAQPGHSTFPGIDEVSCDSCHQVHDANSDSGTYILDAPEENATATSFNTSRQGVLKPSTPNNLDYTGFCDQCHRYTKMN